MPLNMKIFNTLGTVTLVTPPSLINPKEIGFVLINLKESQKNEFAVTLNKLFPNDNVTVFLYDHIGQNAWLRQAIEKSQYIVMDNKDVPIWIDELLKGRDVHRVDESNTVEQAFSNIQTQNNK
tara:strand:- start:1708 stop:2076 length:369 start_codon:yes stop_codon:yes gene_type:complete